MISLRRPISYFAGMLHSASACFGGPFLFSPAPGVRVRPRIERVAIRGFDGYVPEVLNFADFDNVLIRIIPADDYAKQREESDRYFDRSYSEVRCLSCRNRDSVDHSTAVRFLSPRTWRLECSAECGGEMIPLSVYPNRTQHLLPGPGHWTAVDEAEARRIISNGRPSNFYIRFPG